MATQGSAMSGAPRRAKGASHLKRNEFTLVAKVKPGHERQIREAIGKVLRGETGGDPAKLAAETTLHDARFVLFDNDTRFALMTSYEGDWDTYFDDHWQYFGNSWNEFIQHCEEGGYDTIDQMKEWLYKYQVTAVGYLTKYSDVTLRELLRALQVQRAFQQVLDHPDAAQALEHPALKPLLELAAD